MSEPTKPENPLLLSSSDPNTEQPCYITLRDLFAAFALAGMKADPTCSVKPGVLAAEAYDVADAMLEERAK